MLIYALLPCSVRPCRHVMAYPQVADEADGLLIWRVDAKILNRQARAAGKGC
jgi:hypothetical protein